MTPRLLLLAALALAAPAALAHHGWGWTTGQNIELVGPITRVDLGNPHGEIDLDVGGTTWTVEVGQPWRNDRSGLARDALAPGVVVRVSGEPSANPAEKLLKAERLWLGDTEHVLYPDRD